MKRQLAQKLRNSKEGFSIIEVMIVLAVAAVIMVIVFLAVPALQRNNRNTQRRTDVNNVIGAVNEYATNNGGRLPTDTDDFEDNVKFGIYGDAASVSVVPGDTDGPADIDGIVIATGVKCTSQTSADDGTARQFAALFFVETSNSTQLQCLEG